MFIPSLSVSSMDEASPEQVITDITNLPVEVFTLILSRLERKDLQHCAVTSPDLSSLTIKSTNSLIILELRRFVDELIFELNDEDSSIQQNALQRIRANINAEFPNLLQLKEYLLSMKNQIVEILVGLSEEKLINLEDIIVPKFYEKVFVVAKICRGIPGALNTSDQVRRSKALQGISDALLNAGEMERAIAVIDAIQDKKIKDSALCDICTTLLKTGDLEKAKEVAQRIPFEVTQALALQAIINSLLNVGNIDKAIEVSQEVKYGTIKEIILLEIVNYTLVDGNIERALAIADKVNKENSKGSVLLNIVNALLKVGSIDKAMEITQTIPLQSIKEIALSHICNAFVLAGKRDRALDVAKSITNPDFREIALNGDPSNMEQVITSKVYKRVIGGMWAMYDIANSFFRRYHY